MMNRRGRDLARLGAIAAWICLGLGALPAAAQPAETEQHTEALEVEAPEENVTSWEVAAGGVLNTGNTESYQFNSGSNFQLIRGSHGVAAEATAILGGARTAESEDYDENARSFRARARYDYFFTEHDALFAAVAFRHDLFAAIDGRTQLQLGYAHYFIKQEKHLIWGEAGYDFTYDNYHLGPPTDPATVEGIEETQVFHSARLFFGYDNKLNEAVTFRMSLEALINIEDPGDSRFNAEAGLRSTIADNLKLEIKFGAQYDTEPVPEELEKLDTTTQLNLIYTLI